MVFRRRRILLSEIERQSGSALLAYDEAAAALQKHQPDRFWHSLQALVTAAGHLQALLWPAREPVAGAAELRQALGVADGSPLCHPGLAAARNIAGLLESWQAAHPDRTWHASNFAAGGFTGVRSAECIRYFDRESSVYVLCGHIFVLPGLLGAIAELSHRARMETEHLRELV